MRASVRIHIRIRIRIRIHVHIHIHIHAHVPLGNTKHFRNKVVDEGGRKREGERWGGGGDHVVKPEPSLASYTQGHRRRALNVAWFGLVRAATAEYNEAVESTLKLQIKALNMHVGHGQVGRVERMWTFRAVCGIFN